MPELVEQIERCYKDNVENPVKCGLFVLADAVTNLDVGLNDKVDKLDDKVDKLDNRIMDRFTTYDKILASHSRGFKDLRKFITDEVITRLDRDREI